VQIDTICCAFRGRFAALVTLVRRPGVAASLGHVLARLEVAGRHRAARLRSPEDGPGGGRVKV
jgi:hypothetical protein